MPNFTKKISRKSTEENGFDAPNLTLNPAARQEQAVYAAGEGSMSQRTTMQLYDDVVLECQHCYRICRYDEASVRRNCPACGRSIDNWNELTEMARARMRQARGSPPA